MTNAARSCVKCGARCRHVLCDPCFAATPFCDESIAVSREPSGVFPTGLPVRVDGVWSVA